MITINKIFEIYDVNPSEVKLVRHGDKEIPIRDTFRDNLPKLETYQSFQKPNKFGTAKAIAVFTSYYKTSALFLGLWDINGCINNSQFTEETLLELKKHKLPERWFADYVRYKLTRNEKMGDLSERLVIEWGLGTIAWVQSGDKEVIEIKGKKSIKHFESFSLVDLSFEEVTKLVQSQGTNLTWVTALSSVNGIYLISV